MKTTKKYSGFYFSAFPAILLFLITGCQKEIGDGGHTKYFPVSIQFMATVDGDPALIDNSTVYTNTHGEDYTLKTFKFYVSHIYFKPVGSNVEVSAQGEEYFLIDASDPAKQSINVNVPEGEYERIIFTLGIDSTRNVSGAQTGALDPVHGMFWTWNTGYIMAKLEGSSSAAATPNGAFSYHVGGFRTGESAIREIRLNFPSPNKLNVTESNDAIIFIAAEISEWFKTPHSLRIADAPFVHSPGALAVQFADNYSDMFSLLGIMNQ